MGIKGTTNRGLRLAWCTIWYLYEY